MSPLFKRIILGAALAVVLAAPAARAQTEGVEPQARGPIHEGFANAVEGQPTPGVIIEREPPAAIDEVPADQKPEGDNVQWISGYWAWDDARNDFLWVSGFWRVPPPNRSWVPGSWRQAGNGWQWVAGFWAAAAEGGDMNYLPPPPAPVEAGPSVPAPSDDYSYVPGTWVYTSSRYAWRPGMWVMHRPGWLWVPAHYRWTPAGYVFIDGYWDYPLAQRGILFAPVYIDVAFRARPRWYYRPSFAVYDDCLYGSLFVRGGGYYYGDYFEARYTTLGYRSWFSVSFGRSYAYDPLYSYYSYTYRRDPYWAPAIREIYVGRYRGDIPRPSVTVVNNVTNVTNINIVNNPTIINKYPNLGKSKNVTNITNVNNTVVNINNIKNITNNNTTNNNTNVNNTSFQKFTKLQPVTAAQSEHFVSSAKQMHEVGKQRVSAETQLVAKGPPRVNEAPRSLKLDLPKPAVAAGGNVAASANIKPPPPAIVHRATPPITGAGTGTVGGTKPGIDLGKPAIGQKPPAVNPKPPVDLGKPPITNPKPPVDLGKPPVTNPKLPVNPLPASGNPTPKPGPGNNPNLPPLKGGAPAFESSVPGAHLLPPTSTRPTDRIERPVTKEAPPAFTAPAPRAGQPPARPADHGSEKKKDSGNPNR